MSRRVTRSIRYCRSTGSRKRGSAVLPDVLRGVQPGRTVNQLCSSSSTMIWTPSLRVLGISISMTRRLVRQLTSIRTEEILTSYPCAVTVERIYARHRQPAGEIEHSMTPRSSKTMPCTLRVLSIAIHRFGLEARSLTLLLQSFRYTLGAFSKRGHNQHSSKALALVRRLLEKAIRSGCSIECDKDENRALGR